MPRVRMLTPGASPAHHFGSEVRRARQEAGMSLAGLAELVPCDSSTVSRIEAGLITPDLHFAEVCDRAFPFCRGWFARFFADSQQWDGNTALAPAFRDFAEDEQAATAIYTFQHSLVPGLVQTEDYARTVLASHPQVTAAQVAERTRARLDRQAILTGDNPPWLWAVLDQGVLRYDVGGSKVMGAALRRVAEMAARPQVSVQVLPPGVHVAAHGAFIIAEQNGTAASAFVEDATDGRTTDDIAVVKMLSVRFRWLQTLAMTPDASLGMIERAADEHMAQVQLQRFVRQRLRRGSRMAQVKLQRFVRQRLRRGSRWQRRRAGARHHEPGRHRAHGQRGGLAALPRPDLTAVRDGFQ